MGSRRHNKTKRARVDPVAKLASEIGVPLSQVANDRFEGCDVVNHTEADHRAMVRSLGAQMINPDARRTIRRKPKIDELKDRGLINAQEAAACQWYRDAHAMRYDTLGVTARWGGAGGNNGRRDFDHMPKTPEQQIAYVNFEFARAGINRFILGMFERVVLHDRPLGKLGRSFKLAAQQLLERIEGRVQL